MGLKTFHVFFIGLSSLMCFGIAAWSAEAYQQGGGTLMAVHSAAWAVSGICLLVYGVRFIRRYWSLGNP